MLLHGRPSYQPIFIEMDGAPQFVRISRLVVFKRLPRSFPPQGEEDAYTVVL